MLETDRDQFEICADAEFTDRMLSDIRQGSCGVGGLGWPNRALNRRSEARSDVQDLKRLIVHGIESFRIDPPDTPYQVGYSNALKEPLQEAGIPVPRYAVGRRAPEKRPTTTPKRNSVVAP